MNRGFSLLELSIVLVIIGLIAGGIVAGSSMIRAAELRKVLTQQEQFKTAIYTFKDKYLAIPGDMKNATAFWGELHATPATCIVTETTSGTATCDGDGSNTIRNGSNTFESYRFWQHLANAGLINGAFTGRADNAAATSWVTVAGKNVPAGPLGGSAWLLGYDISSGTAMFPIATTRHNFRLGGEQSGTWPSGRIFTPDEVWNLDKKIDDGKPALGQLTAPLDSYATNCVTDDTLTAEYELALDGVSCIAFFAAGF